MTIELLDTDTEQGGEMAEVERWSEYVDKYLCIGDNISDELKQQLARKPVFLSRFVSSPPHSLVVMKSQIILLYVLCVFW